MPTLQKWLQRCEFAFIVVAIICTAGMMLLTSFDAMGRYLFNNPIMGAYELTEKYLIIATIFLGLPYAFRGGIFIRVTFLVDRLPLGARLIADHVAHVITLGCLAILLFATATQSLRALSDATTLNTLPILIAPAYCLVPIGFAALLVAMLIDLPRVRRGNSFLLTADAPEAS